MQPLRGGRELQGTSALGSKLVDWKEEGEKIEMETSSISCLEIQEGMDGWQKWWLEFNKQIPQLQSGKCYKKRTTSEKVIKHPSSLQLIIHSSKLIINLGLLVLWVKNSGFPGPFYVRKRATRHQNHWHQEANSQSVTTALRQYE